MKKKHFLFLTLFSLFITNAQIVNFTDNNLKTKILSSSSYNTIAKDVNNQYFSVDENHNGQIENSEAQNVYYLDVSYSSIASLQGIEMFTNLRELKCNNNQITTLDARPFTSLRIMYCENNQMTSLLISGMPNLTSLMCYQNQLSTLNLSNLPSLVGLSCGQNSLTSLNVNGLNNLGSLFCSNNQISTLDVSNLPKLQYLQCMDNQMTSLTTNNLPLLESITCYNNLITSIDVSSAPNCMSIYCQNNQLNILIIKNGRGPGTVDFSNNPNIHYICADENEISYVQSWINMYGYSSSCIVNSYCSFVPGGTYYVVKGNTKFDVNSNGCDASDLNYPNLKINYTNGTISGSIIADNSGNYLVPFTSGSHTLTPAIENPTYFSVSPTTSYVSFPSTSSPYIQNFCLAYNGTHNDLEIKIFPLTPARPGFDTKYKIIYHNIGAISQSGSINLNFNDSVLDLVESTPAPIGQTTNNLSWSFSNLQSFETREILVIFNANSPMENPALNAGSNLIYTATISGPITDEDMSDNTFKLVQTVVNSYDPNDKRCLEGNAIPTAKVGDYVHYMIRFENSGTFPAENIVVKDIIDISKFDITTLLPVTGSHSFVTKTTNPNTVEFIFENINLPFSDDSNDGYVVFKIKTKPTLTSGTTFTNKANIYFDYNFPIITNTTSTIVSNALSNTDFEFEKFISLYPNPVKDLLKIHNNQNINITSLSIYNNLGQLIQIITNPSNEVDVSKLNVGSYFLKIMTEKGNSTTKFMKE